MDFGFSMIAGSLKVEEIVIFPVVHLAGLEIYKCIFHISTSDMHRAIIRVILSFFF